ncbi:hypothetical protein QBC41DRAFT_388098 [Cercophora samala]|uniref:F-box domain-containing protein n=1 Tax=Cercophora samala TaxID=330535 RepID=A0AA39ZMM7_9PEZI|nr:hypothetical protein QBC41DRAFT_388098 [Cercophora samala]
MDANDLEDNDWVDDVLDVDFVEDDDEEWDIADLVYEPQNEAQRLFFQRILERERRTEEEIEALGIRPDVPSIVLHMNRWEEEARSGANGRAVPTVCNLSARVRRIYHRRPREYASSSSSEEEESEDEEAAIAKHEEEFEAAWASQLIEQGLENSNPLLQREYRAIARERFLSLQQSIQTWKKAQKPPKRPRPTIDLLSTLCTTPELLIEVCKHLRPRDLVNLYALHRGFHNTLNHNMRQFVFAWSRSMAPAASRIYSSPVYSHWFIPDPTGRKATPSDREMSLPQPGQASLLGGETLRVNNDARKTRLVPGLLWLQHVVHREVRVRDILAVLARHGHRTLPKTNITLQKIWLVLDCPTNKMRLTLVCNEGFFLDEDLYRFQHFFVKLVLLFNDPFFGPGSTVLARLFLGQKGLTPLWKFLRRKAYTTEAGVRQLRLRYDVPPKNREVWEGRPVMGVQIYDMGVGQYEGWEKGGYEILMRPEELVSMEAGRRGLGAMVGWEVLFGMMTYGHVDYETGDNQVPSLEEMYMSDDEEEGKTGLERVARLHENEIVNGGCGNVAFERGMWMPKHARKKRWKELSKEEREEMVKEEEKEMARKERVNKGMDMFRLARRRLGDVYNITAMGFKGKRFKLKMPDPKADWKEEISEIHQMVLFRMKAAMAAARAVIAEEPDSPPRPTKLPRLEDVGVENNQVVEAVDGNTNENTNEDMDVGMDVEMENVGVLVPDHNMDVDEGYDAESEEFDDEGWEEYENDHMEIDSPPSTVALRPAPTPPPPQSAPPPPTLSDYINHDNHINTIWSSPPSNTPPDPASFDALPISEQYPLLFGPELPSSQNLSPSHGAHAISQATAHLPPENHLWDPSNITLRQPSPPDANSSSDLDFSDSELETIPIPRQEISRFLSGEYMTPTPPAPGEEDGDSSSTPTEPPSSDSSSDSSPEPSPPPQPQPEPPVIPQPEYQPPVQPPPPPINIPVPNPVHNPIPGSPTSSTDPEDWPNSDSDHQTTLDDSPPPPLPPHLQPLESMSLPEAALAISQEEDQALMDQADIEYDSATEDDVNDPEGGIDWEHYVDNMEMYRSGPGRSWCLQRVPVHADWKGDQAKEDEWDRKREGEMGRIRERIREVMMPGLGGRWTAEVRGEVEGLVRELGGWYKQRWPPEHGRQAQDQAGDQTRSQAGGDEDHQNTTPPPRGVVQTCDPDREQAQQEQDGVGVAEEKNIESERSVIQQQMEQLRPRRNESPAAAAQYEQLRERLKAIDIWWQRREDASASREEFQSQQPSTQGQQQSNTPNHQPSSSTSSQPQQPPTQVEPSAAQVQHHRQSRLLPNLETVRRQRWPAPDDDFWESPRVRKARDWYPPW